MTVIQNARDIFEVFGSFYYEVRDVAFYFIFVFLVISLIAEFLKGMEGKANYPGLFIRIFLLSGLFSIYTPFVREVIEGMDTLAQFFMPSEDFKQTFSKVFTVYKENKDLGMMALIKMTFLEWTVQGTFNLAYAVMKGFTWVRFVFLSALYLTGPILIGVGFFLPGIVSSWIRWLFEISAWNVVLSLFVRILAQMNFFELYQQTQLPALDLVAMNLIVILMICLFVPMFSSMMIRGAGGLSGAGGAIFGIGGALLVKQISKRISGIKDHFRAKTPSKQNISYRRGS